MAFTTVSRVLSIDNGTWQMWGSQSPYFYPEDIAIIMGQSFIDAEGNRHPVVSFQCVVIEGQNEDDTEVLSSLAMIGLWYDPVEKNYRRLDHGNALLALGCGRGNNTGAFFENRIQLKADYKDITPKVLEGPDPYHAKR